MKLNLPSHDRLVDVAHQLLGMGVRLHEIGPRFYDSLTGSDDRARLFRAGLGLSAPLPRGAASDLAAEVERQLRGPRDHVFAKQLVLAHLLNNLIQATLAGHPWSRDLATLALIIAADGDDAGEQAANHAAERFIREGRTVRIAQPESGNDFNDVLRQEATA
jgi:Toprim domain